MKKFTLLTLLFCFLFPLTGCSGSEIDLVKQASFRGYETTTIGKMLDGTFEKTKWSSQQNAKGETLVLFEGKIPKRMHDTLKDGVLQFMAADARTSDSFAIATYTAGHIPTVLGRDRTGDRFAEPLLSECQQKYRGNVSNFPPERVKSEIANYKELLAKEAASGFYNYSETYLREELAKWEAEWAIIQGMQSPAWEAGKRECTDKLMQVANRALDELFWVEGDTVFFEWKIHSNGKDFELSRFGGQSMPQLNINMALKIIYEQ